MSGELLWHLADRYAFDSTPPFVDLGAYHVAFDDLTGGQAVERRLLDAVARGERVALVASSGSGKSSVVASVLGPTAERVAPIVVPVGAVPPDGVTSPLRIADEVLALVRRYAADATDVTADERATIVGALGERRHVTRTHGRSGGVALALGWIRPHMARELTQQTEHEELVTLREKTEVLDQVLRIIAADRLQPVLVFDDSDRWLGTTNRDVVTRFFGGVVRWLTELPTAVVVAVHDRYFTEVPRAEVLQFLDTPVELPRLTGASQLGRILDHRVSLNVVDSPLEGAGAADGFEPDALAALFTAYAAGASLRRVIQRCHVALTEAVERGGGGRLTATDVAAAANAG